MGTEATPHSLRFGHAFRILPLGLRWPWSPPRLLMRHVRAPQQNCERGIAETKQQQQQHNFTGAELAWRGRSSSHDSAIAGQPGAGLQAPCEAPSPRGSTGRRSWRCPYEAAPQQAEQRRATAQRSRRRRCRLESRGRQWHAPSGDSERRSGADMALQHVRSSESGDFSATIEQLRSLPAPPAPGTQSDLEARNGCQQGWSWPQVWLACAGPRVPTASWTLRAWRARPYVIEPHGHEHTDVCKEE